MVEFDKVPHENSMEKINALMSRTEDTVFKKNLEQALDIVEECFNRLVKGTDDVISSDHPFKKGYAQLTLVTWGFTHQRQKRKCQKKRRYFPHCFSDKGLNGDVVNCACYFINGRTFEITLTVPLKSIV